MEDEIRKAADLEQWKRLEWLSNKWPKIPAEYLVEFRACVERWIREDRKRREEEANNELSGMLMDIDQEDKEDSLEAMLVELEEADLRPELRYIGGDVWQLAAHHGEKGTCFHQYPAPSEAARAALDKLRKEGES